MFHLILLCFSLRLCIRKCYCVLEKIVVHQENSLCSGKDCCVPESIVVFSKRLLCSSKDCCVSEQELSCVLPVWVTVVFPSSSDASTHFHFETPSIGRR